MKYFLFLIAIFPLELMAASFSWKPPVERENGDPLTIAEIGGYELVGYDGMGAELWRSIIEGGDKTCFVTQEPGSVFKIAAFDTNGLYSEFVPITTRLCAPSDFRLEAPKEFQFD